MEPAGRASELAWRASEPAGRALDPIRKASEQVRRAAEEAAALGGHCFCHDDTRSMAAADMNRDERSVNRMTAKILLHSDIETEMNTG